MSRNSAAQREGVSVMVALCVIAGGALLLSGLARARFDDPHGRHQASAALPDMRLDLNAASLDELRVLPGIGEALAERIAADRAQVGPFRSLEELTRVHGIGEKTIEHIRPWVVVVDPGD